MLNGRPSIPYVHGQWSSLPATKGIQGRRSFPTPPARDQNQSAKISPINPGTQQEYNRSSQILHFPYSFLACLPQRSFLPSSFFRSLYLQLLNCRPLTSLLRLPALQHFHRAHFPFLLSSFCLLVSSPIPNELYPFVFFRLRNLSNK